MRIFVSLGVVATIIIAACMFYLIKVGVALRTQPIIKPSVIKEDDGNVARGVSQRLLPVLRETPYVLLGFGPLDGFRGPLFQKIIQESEKVLNKKINILDGLSAREEELQNCEHPCWILLPVEMASDLDRNLWIETNLNEKSRRWASITILPFVRGISGMRQICKEQKKVSLDCMTEISVEEVDRKLRKNEERSFFMRAYLEKNYFLFYEMNLELNQGSVGTEETRK